MWPMGPLVVFVSEFKNELFFIGVKDCKQTGNVKF